MVMLAEGYIYSSSQAAAVLGPRLVAFGSAVNDVSHPTLCPYQHYTHTQSHTVQLTPPHYRSPFLFIPTPPPSAARTLDKQLQQSAQLLDQGRTPSTDTNNQSTCTTLLDVCTLLVTPPTVSDR